MKLQRRSIHAFLLGLFLIIGTEQLAAQSDSNAVRKPIQALFDGMRRGDTTLIKSAFSPSAQLQTIIKNKEGQTTVRTDQIQGFIAAVGKPQPAVLDERISFGAIHIDGDLATVWTPYHFYVGEAFSHCGVNSFQLVKWNGEWKIQYVIDTRRKEGCK